MQTIGIYDETSSDFAPQLKACSHLYVEDFGQIPCEYAFKKGAQRAPFCHLCLQAYS